MDDRELLEKAAEAIGGHLFIGNVSTGGLAYWLEFDDDLATARVWNPLENDGEAFRLMVALGIDVVYYTSFQEVEATPDVRDFDSVSIGFTDDRNKDTRRAIVRAAAAMEAPCQ